MIPKPSEVALKRQLEIQYQVVFTKIMNRLNCEIATLRENDIQPTGREVLSIVSNAIEKAL